VKWPGKEPLVIGSVDQDGNVVDEIIVQPGGEIPERAIELMRAAKDITDVPRFTGEKYSRAGIKAAFKGKQ
jgi:hypothetical protein